MDQLTVLLSRIQFGFTIGFHILYPTLNIGLAVFICIMEGIWLKTKNPVYLKICKFWIKIFALTFGMGVVSGIVMSYELGTNFGRFTALAGPLVGPLFGYEVLSAFFLEAGFLGVMLFGWNRVGPKLHFAATLLVMVGTVISAFWIMSANSWMQTPAGYHTAEGKLWVDTWTGAIFNPSFVPRLTHMIFASLLTTIFVVAGVSAWFLLKNRYIEIAKPCFSVVLWAALIVTPLQVLLGDEVGLRVFQYQPLKTAAIEGNWNTMAGAPLILFAIPDPAQRKNLFELSIPYGASLINTHSRNGVLKGLNSVAPTDWPVIIPTFFGFRAMVGIGVIFFTIALWALWLRWRKKIYDSRSFLWVCILASPLGFVATIAGWITAESGRQPWTVYNIMRTQDAASIIPLVNVSISLFLLAVVYTIIFIFYLYYLLKIIHKGPVELEKPPITLGYITHPQDERLQ